MRRTLLVALAACGGRQPVAPVAHARLDLLAGELSAEPPIAANIEPNEADDIMSAPPAAADETAVRLRDSTFHGVAVFRREWLACAKDPAATAREYADFEKRGTIDVTQISPMAFTLFERAPTHRGKAVELGFIAVCAGDVGLISAHLLIDGDDVERGKQIMTAFGRTIALGPAPSKPGPRDVALAACGKTVTVAMPAGYRQSEDVGTDFSVHHFRRVGGSGGFAVYIGHYGKSFAPDDAPTIELPGAVHAQRWQDDDGVHLQRIESVEGCTVHGFGVMGLVEESELRALMGFAVSK